MKALNNSQPVRRCTHINAKGDVCHRPAVRDNNHCYIHFEDPALQPGNGDCETDFEPPAIENPALIQVAIDKLLTARKEGKITRRRASLYIYALQIARQNTKQLQRAGNRKAQKGADKKRADLVRPT